jgi:hypothetical protein
MLLEDSINLDSEAEWQEAEAWLEKRGRHGPS